MVKLAIAWMLVQLVVIGERGLGLMSYNRE